MMLPSGNDAAFTVCEYFSHILYLYKYRKIALKNQEKVRSFNYGKHHIRWFLHEMNHYGKELGLKDSHFDSPHGLMNRFNQSTVQDQAKLTHACMKIPLFRKVVGTHRCETWAFQSPDPDLNTHYKWTSTNKMLGSK
jgi:D-alanyl-D-alanine carboxypeptidase